MGHNYIKVDNGFAQEISLPIALQLYEKHFLHRMLVWPVGLGTSMTSDMELDITLNPIWNS